MRIILGLLMVFISVIIIVVVAVLFYKSYNELDNEVRNDV